PSTESLPILNEAKRLILQGLENPWCASDLPDSSHAFLVKLFPFGVLEQLLGARESLRQSEWGESDLAFMLLSKIVDQSSHSQTDGIYKAPTTQKRSISPAEACHDLYARILEDLVSLQPPYYSERSRIFPRSSENMEEIAPDSVSLVVTSPPYLNNFDYA